MKWDMVKEEHELAQFKLISVVYVHIYNSNQIELNGDDLLMNIGYVLSYSFCNLYNLIKLFWFYLVHFKFNSANSLDLNRVECTWACQLRGCCWRWGIVNITVNDGVYIQLELRWNGMA